MTREIIGALMIGLVPLFAALAFAGVRRRRKLQEQSMPQPHAALSSNGLDCIYVATVFAARPLDRVWAFGLGSRGNAKVEYDDGLLSINRVGERSFGLNPRLVELSRATIDKGVEASGLVSIHWQLGEEQLITQLRFSSSANQKIFLASLGQIAGVK